MLDDLVRISNLYQADQELDRLAAAIAALHAADADAAAALDRARAARAAEQEALEALRAEEVANARELAQWSDARASTQRALDTGAADWQAAERQIAAARARIDALEDRGLELLDRIERGDAALVRATRVVEDAEAQRALRLTEREARLPGLEAAQAAARTRRAAAAAELPSEYREAYADVRRRRRPALVNVVDGICSSCSMRVPAMRVAEALDNRAVHSCTGCGGWILP